MSAGRDHDPGTKDGAYFLGSKASEQTKEKIKFFKESCQSKGKIFFLTAKTTYIQETS